MDIKEFRKSALKELTDKVGVYALCDLDGQPIYIGQSTDGIKARVSRHITSARSDVIANRQLDIWEVCQIWAWPIGDKLSPKAPKEEKELQKKTINILETHLIHHYDKLSPLVNGKIPKDNNLSPSIPDKQIVKLMSDSERSSRLESTRRLPRQMDHLTSLFSHIMEVKNNPEQRRMLKVHFDRASNYYNKFMSDSGEKSNM